MKKFKVIKQYRDIKEGTIVIDEGVSDVEDCRLVLIEGDAVPITYSVPVENLEEME